MSKMYNVQSFSEEKANILLILFNKIDSFLLWLKAVIS